MVLEWCSACSDFTNGILTGVGIGLLLALGLTVIIVIFLASYIYFAFAWMTIARKLKRKHSWLAWVPVANVAYILHVGGFHWAWIFLALIPVLGWIALIVLFVISNWWVFDKRKYPGWFSLSLIIPQLGWILYLIALGFAAWADKR